MTVKNVLIELRQFSTFEHSLTSSPSGFAPLVAAVPRIQGLTIDQDFPILTIEKVTRQELRNSFVAETSPQFFLNEESTHLMRASIQEESVDTVLEAISDSPDIIRILADPKVQICEICIDTPFKGSSSEISELLNVPKLLQNKMDGTDVLLAIVDAGLNIDFLRQRHPDVKFDVKKSWTPQPLPGQPPVILGKASVGSVFECHGTMCAFDALIAAPKATIIDIAALPLTRGGLLSDVVRAYCFLNRLLNSERQKPDFRGLVVSNSWVSSELSSDFPPGHPSNYSHNPDHVFNQMIEKLELGGADILFAAGNNGQECLKKSDETDGKPDSGITGANSHPRVICVAGVDRDKNRVGYSSRGPGALETNKPDICAFTHFSGSTLTPADSGTSAATGVAAGMVAAIRSRLPTSSVPPATLRKAIINMAEDRGAQGFDFEYGAGVIDGGKLSNL